MTRINSKGNIMGTAKHDQKACIRCGQPVTKGQAMIQIEIGPKKRWVHSGCEEPATGAADNQRVEQLEKRVDETEKAIVELASAQPQVKSIELHKPDGMVVTVSAAVPECFEKLVFLANMRANIFLPGPTGCGKTHTARLVAKALGLQFGMISCSAGMSEGQITGRLVPVGEGGKFEYVRSEFVRLYEEGGVFLFDEIDAADSNVLLTINAALANGHLPVPNRPDKPMATRHPDFICIAAANTFGRGADRMYCGRNQLDEATLDRFRIGTVEMDYNATVEQAICPDRELYDALMSWRQRIVSHRLRRVLSTRFVADAYKARTFGASIDWIADQFFSGWSADESAKVRVS